MSRIARHATSRRAEHTTLAATVAAWTLTVLVVGWGATESNGIAAALVEQLGWTVVGILALGVEAGAFAVFRAIHRRGYRRSAAAGGLALLAVALGDLAINVAVVPWGGLSVALVGVKAATLAPVVLAGVLLAGRRQLVALARGISRPSEMAMRRAGAIILVGVLLISSAGPLVSFSVGQTEAATDDVLDDFEDTDFTDWTNTSLGNNSHQEIRQNTTYSFKGDASAEVFNADTEADGLKKNFSQADPTNLSAWYRFQNFDTRYLLWSSDGGTTTVHIQIASDNNIIPGDPGDVMFKDSSGSWVNTNISVSQNQGYVFELTNITYSNDTYDLTVYHPNGTVRGVRSDMELKNNQGIEAWEIGVGGDGGGRMLVDYIKSGKAVFGNGGSSLTNTVVDQSGNPVANATVTALAVNTSALDVNPSRYEEKAQELLQKAKNISLPKNYTRNPSDLVARLKDTSGKYAIANTASDWSLAPGVSGVSLGTPATQVPPTERVVFHVRDATQSPTVQDTVDEDLPGIVVDDTDIVIQQLGPGGGVIQGSNRTIETNRKFETGLTGWPGLPDSFVDNTHEFGVTTLPRGIYRYYPEGSPGTPSILVVGKPDQILNGWVTELKNRRGNLLQRAQWIQEKINDSTFTKKTFTTNANGTFSPSYPSNVQTVAYTAYKGPLDRLAEDPQNVTMSDLRALYTAGYNGSVYLSDSTIRAGASENVTIPVREYSSPSFINSSRFNDLWERFQDRLRNETFLKNLPAFAMPSGTGTPGETAAETTARLRAVYGNLTTVVNASQPLKESYLKLSNRSEVAPPDSLSQSELRTEIGLLRAAMRTTAPSLEVPEPDVSTSNNSLSAEWILPGELSNLDVSILARWSNGTTQPVPAKYIERDSRLGRDDVLRVTEFPIGESDPASVSLILDVAGAPGYGSSEASVTNPTFSGTKPALKAISLSSLQPAKGESVTLDVDPEDRTNYGNLTAATVVSSDGTTVNATHVDDQTIRFTPTETGVWTIAATITSPEGTPFEVRIPFEVRSVDKNRPPSIRALDSTLGTYALVGDGLESGSVSLSQGGTEVNLAAQISQEADAPQELQVYAHGLSLPPQRSLTTRLVRGENQQAVNQQVVMTIHQPAVPDDGTLYVNGDAVPRDGETSVAQVNTSGTQTVITAVSGDNGAVTVETNGAPGFISSFLYDLRVGGLPLVGMISVPIPAPTGLSAGAGAGMLGLAGAAGAAARRRGSA